MRLSRFLLGVAVGATLMYLFDPHQGPQRRELWGERLRQGRAHAQTAVESGRHRYAEFRHTEGDPAVTAGRRSPSHSANGDGADD